MTDLTNPIFTDKNKARKHLEKLRWADGRFCPHCGATEDTSFVRGKKHRPELYYCNTCKKRFTVTVGTIFERSKIPLNKWMLAFHLMASSKKGVSAHLLHRMLGITYKSAWFMVHCIRESMREDRSDVMSGPGGAVEVDETYFSTKDEYRGKTWDEKKRHSKKMSVVSLVSEGKSRTFVVHKADAHTVRKILVTHVDRASELHTDESRIYSKTGYDEEFARHRKIVHAHGQYGGPDGETTNHVENYFSVFKREMRGVYQHCKEKHLQRYIDEFDFRYNARGIEDAERRDKALKGADGKRLTYQQPVGQA